MLNWVRYKHNLRRLTLLMVMLPLIINSSQLYATLLNEQPKLSTVSSHANKYVTVYLLIDTPDQLKRYVDDLAKVKKANFNRVVFSFVRPTLTHYEQGNLANTGILGYFDQGDGQGIEAFKRIFRTSKNNFLY